MWTVLERSGKVLLFVGVLVTLYFAVQALREWRSLGAELRDGVRSMMSSVEGGR